MKHSVTQPLRLVPQHLMRFLALLLILTTSLGAVMPVQGAAALQAGVPAGVPAVVRLDLAPEQTLQAAEAALFTVQAPVFAQRNTPDGRPYWLLNATPEQQAALSQSGFTVTVLASDSRGASYYWLRDEALKAAPAGSVLDFTGQMGFARLTLDQEQALSADYWLPEPLLPQVLQTGESSSAIPADIDYNPFVQAMIDQVLTNDIYSLMEKLTGEVDATIGGSPFRIATRSTSSASYSEKSTQFAYEYLQALGLSTSYHTYPYSGGSRRNVVANKPGSTQPSRIFLLTGHLDDTSQTASTYAPGADDNGSGSAGVMLAAKIMSQYSFGCTVRYVLFTGEEQGLYGSEAYAAYIKGLNENVEAVLNLDMISYNSTGQPAPIIDLHTRYNNASDLAIANLFIDVIDTYNLNLQPEIFQDNIAYSDHYSFWQQGYPAILGIEDDDDFTPYYHTTSDRLSTLDMAYFTAYVKAAVASMAHMGCLVQGNLDGFITVAGTGARLGGASVEVKDTTGGTWNTVSDSNGYYQLALPPNTYSIKITAPGYNPYTASPIVVPANITTHHNAVIGSCGDLQAVSFTYTPEQPFTGQEITFTPVITGNATVTYAWNFGDGTTSTEEAPSHAFVQAKNYNVTLSVDMCGYSKDATRSIPVSLPPKIGTETKVDAFLLTDKTTSLPFMIRNLGSNFLSWSLQEDPDEVWLDVSSIQGSIPAGASQTLTLTFQGPSIPGIYTTTLQIASNDPVRPSVAVPVKLEVPCIEVNGLGIKYESGKHKVGEAVNFTAKTLFATLPVQYSWDFGDGTTAAGPQVTHTFTTPGSHTVKLTAENCAGPVSSQTQVQITGAPHLALTPPPAQITVQASTSFTAPLTLENQGAEPLTWSLVEDPALDWLTLDQYSGTLEAGEQQSVVLQGSGLKDAGIYTVTLRLETNDPRLEPSWISMQVLVPCAAISSASISLAPTTPLLGQPVQFAAQTSAAPGPLQYVWDFGDGSNVITTTQSSLAHTFEALPGGPDNSFAVQLSVSNSCSTQAAAQDVTVLAPLYLPVAQRP